MCAVLYHHPDAEGCAPGKLGLRVNEIGEGKPGTRVQLDQTGAALRVVHGDERRRRRMARVHARCVGVVTQDRIPEGRGRGVGIDETDDVLAACFGQFDDLGKAADEKDALARHPGRRRHVGAASRAQRSTLSARVAKRGTNRGRSKPALYNPRRRSFSWRQISRYLRREKSPSEPWLFMAKLSCSLPPRSNAVRTRLRICSTTATPRLASSTPRLSGERWARRYAIQLTKNSTCRASSCMIGSKSSTSGGGKKPDSRAIANSPKAKNASKHSPYSVRVNSHGTLRTSGSSAR